MSPPISLIPAFDDNYLFTLSGKDSSGLLIVDPGDFTPIKKSIIDYKIKTCEVFLTHQHSDHIGGLSELIDYCKKEGIDLKNIYAPEAHRHQIKTAFTWLNGGERLEACGYNWDVLFLPGHTAGHIGFYCEEIKAIFLGDVLFGLGCGRLFEGTSAEMFESLKKIKKLPAETLVYCAHEYTERNLNFCKNLLSKKHPFYLPDAVEFENYSKILHDKRKRQMPSVPLRLKDELQCNPFLLASTVEQFAELRKLRNEFKS